MIAEIIVLFLILVINVAVYLALPFLVKDSPEVISGFKWSTTEEGRIRDRQWVGLLCRSMHRMGWGMLVGGMVSIAFIPFGCKVTAIVLFLFFVVVMPLIVTVWLYRKRKC